MSRLSDEQTETLLYMKREGASPMEAAKHFFPGASPDDHRRIAQKFSKWAKRHGGKVGLGDAPPPARPASQSPPTQASRSKAPAPMMDVAKMDPVARLEWVVARAAAALDFSLKRGDAKGVSIAVGSMVSAGKELDQARERQSAITGLERSPVGLEVAQDQTSEVRKRLRKQRRAMAKARSL